MSATRARPLELIALGVAEVAALLILASQAGRVLTLLCATVLPLAAWLYARWRARRHLCTIVGAACGLAAFPVSRGLFSLMFLPFPFQLVGVLGLMAESLHGLPGSLVATLAHLEPSEGTVTALMLLDFLLNGIVWAAIYGLVGAHLDRQRYGPPVALP